MEAEAAQLANPRPPDTEKTAGARRKALEILPTIEECRPPAKQQRAASSKRMPVPVPKPKAGTVARSLSPAATLCGQALSISPPVPKAPSFKAAPNLPKWQLDPPLFKAAPDLTAFYQMEAVVAPDKASGTCSC